MANHIGSTAILNILKVLRAHPDGLSAQEISQALNVSVPLRTLQYRLRHLLDEGSLEKTADGRATRYHFVKARIARDSQSLKRA